MKTSAMRWMIAVAALAVAASGASAQTFKAQVPMSFQAAGKQLAAGSYEIRASGGAMANYFVYNRTDQSGVILLAGPAHDVPDAWRSDRTPRVTFQCLDGQCSLKSVWTGTNSYVQTFATPKAAGGDLTAHRLQTVTLTMIKVR